MLAQMIEAHEAHEADKADHDLDALVLAAGAAHAETSTHAEAVAIAKARKAADDAHRAQVWDTLVALWPGGEQDGWLYGPQGSITARGNVPSVAAERVRWAAAQLERLVAQLRADAARRLAEVPADEIRLRRATAALRRLAARYAAPAEVQS